MKWTGGLLLALALAGCALAAGRELLAPSPTEQLNAQRAAQSQQAAAAQAQRTSTRRLNPPCYMPSSFYPFRTCALTQNATECGRGFNAFPTQESCCAKNGNGMWKEGCTDFNRNLTCYVAGGYWPTQKCIQTTDFVQCSQNWGQWATEAACCKPGKAFEDGCTKPAPCYVANNWYPRTCGLTEDQDICQRGWGAFATETACCAPGAAHSEGCNGDAAAAM